MGSIEGAEWRKSSYSGGNGGACVEVASNLPGVIAIRDSKNSSGPTLIFSHDHWRTFVAAVHDGEFGAS